MDPLSGGWENSIKTKQKTKKTTKPDGKKIIGKKKKILWEPFYHLLLA